MFVRCKRNILCPKVNTHPGACRLINKQGKRGFRGFRGKQGNDGEDGEDGEDGKDGEQGEQGEQGEPGEPGLIVVYEKDNDDYFSINKIPSPAQRISQKIDTTEFVKPVNAKLTEAKALLEEAGTLNLQTRKLGALVYTAGQDFERLKKACVDIHDQIKAASVTPLTQQFVTVQFKLQDTLSIREMTKVTKVCMHFTCVSRAIHLWS